MMNPRRFTGLWVVANSPLGDWLPNFHDVGKMYDWGILASVLSTRVGVNRPY